MLCFSKLRYVFQGGISLLALECREHFPTVKWAVECLVSGQFGNCSDLSIVVVCFLVY